MSKTPPKPPEKRPGSARHTRAIRRDRSKRPPVAPPDPVVAERRSELIHPATLAPVAHFHALGLRERTLTLPVVVALVLSVIWRQIGSVATLLRLLNEEGFLWTAAVQVSAQALSQRLRVFPAERFERVLLAVLPPCRRGGRRDARYGEVLRTEQLAIPGMLGLLERMNEHCFTTVIVTASHREHFDIIHGRSGMLEHVDFAVVREDYPRAKPYPDGYLAGIERAGLAARDCIAVEDSPRGIAAARAAGLECVFFTPGGVGADRDVRDVFARAGSAEELEVVLGQWLRQ